ncbi:helix-turn-helix transcriptional regulator [uncultured Roseivirga sp.]|uniref:helix-turn-helix transcriptional regulator n=1 Tax=uncultured Roseivirga sp. TaxID=543088 RepID=UPI0030D7E196|tara:strand:- start:296330 stop:296701 length:372 start_codon:yes stop_codon:yes gene_type:complete
MSVNDRIELLMKHFGLSVNSLAEQLDFSRTAVYNIISEKGRRTSPSHDFYIKLKESYENIDLNWLITGEGEMLLDENRLMVADSAGEYKVRKPQNSDLQKALAEVQEELKAVNKRIDRLEEGH